MSAACWLVFRKCFYSFYVCCVFDYQFYKLFFMKLLTYREKEAIEDCNCIDDLIDFLEKKGYIILGDNLSIIDSLKVKLFVQKFKQKSLEQLEVIL